MIKWQRGAMEVFLEMQLSVGINDDEMKRKEFSLCRKATITKANCNCNTRLFGHGKVDM